MTHIAIWIIAFLSIAGVIIRPFKIPEAVWAVGGAIILIVFKLISPSDGLDGLGNGLNGYFFLAGMM